MRDYIKTESYFLNYINNNTILLEKLEHGFINTGHDAQKRRRYISAIAILKYNLIKARYSAGFQLIEIKQQYEDFLKIIFEFWTCKSSILYIYDAMSLAILFDISNEDFFALYKLVREYNREDALTNFYSEYKLNNNIVFIGDVSYGYPYDTLKNIINDQDNRLIRLKNYIENDWYKGNHDAFWYDSHKNNKDSYYGYWSLEAGAIAKILQIDDISLKDVPYYPYDLVHYSGN